VSKAIVTVVDDPAAVARAAAERFVETAREAATGRGRFTVVLSGGSTPRRLYSLLATPDFRDRVDWEKTIILFGDERCVGPEDAESNYRMARETLLDHVPLSPVHVHRMFGEAGDPTTAAWVYEAVLRGLFPDESFPLFDLVLLGIGTDGHTASLFPGTDALQERERWVAANHVPKLDAWRITMTAPALAAGRTILFLVTGQKKSRVFAEVFGDVPHEPPHPCESIVPVNGVLESIADRDAGGSLSAG
jgi:6-phosphogluconolactonase